MGANLKITDITREFREWLGDGRLPEQLKPALEDLITDLNNALPTKNKRKAFAEVCPPALKDAIVSARERGCSFASIAEHCKVNGITLSSSLLADSYRTWTGEAPAPRKERAKSNVGKVEANGNGRQLAGVK